MTNSYRVLVVDDDYQPAALVCEVLRTAGAFTVGLAMDIPDMWDRLETKVYDVLLFADRFSESRLGGDIILQISARCPSIPVIVLSDRGDERAAVQAMQQGAADYVVKRGDFLMSLPVLIPRVIQAHRARLTHQRALDCARLLMDNLPEAIVAWDLLGQIVLWNLKAEALLGWPCSDVIERDAQMIYFSLFNPPLAPAGPDVPEETEVVCQVQTRRQEVIWVSSRLIPVRDPASEGQIVGYMHISRNTPAGYETVDPSRPALEISHDA